MCQFVQARVPPISVSVIVVENCVAVKVYVTWAVLSHVSIICAHEIVLVRYFVFYCYITGLMELWQFVQFFFTWSIPRAKNMDELLLNI